MVLRDVAQTIIDSAIRSSLPDEAVKRALKNCRFEKRSTWLRLEKLRGKWPERQLTASEAKFRMEL